ncbi:MAG: hypothetical protein ACKPH3_26020, partial [Dolichospermum sp.]
MYCLFPITNYPLPITSLNRHDTASSASVKYTLCGQDARTTRVLLLISVLHNIGNCCITFWLFSIVHKQR